MARSLRFLRQVATLRHGHMARRSASVRSCIQGVTGRFGKDVSAKKIRDVSANFSCRNVPYYLVFFLGFLQTGPNQFVKNQKQNQDNIPVCRILELKKNDETINVGMMQNIKGASDMS